MARIRTIKPEFPQSESIGRVSRDARLLFIMLWTISDDEGRARASSRMLASLLFPYDDDAAQNIPEWLMELERERCIRVYVVDGNTYLQIEKWLDHQKIDHPSKSKLPSPPEKIAKAREGSRKSRSGKEGKGEEGTKDQGWEGTYLSADADVAVEEYNSVARDLGWPEAQVLTDTRSKQLRARLKDCGGIEGWHSAMAKARASPFLRGDSGRDKAHEGWVPDLDFFIQPKSFTKLMEGKYDQRDSRSPTGFDALRAGANRAAGLDGRQGPGMASEPDPIKRLAVAASTPGGIGNATNTG
jgi:hypothetical protein